MHRLIGAVSLALAMLPLSSLADSGSIVRYQVDSDDYEGYYVSPTGGAPLVFLIHDWDGLTGYEKKRADMLADMGYAVFAADLFGAGVRPTTTEAKRAKTGSLYKNREKLRALMSGALTTAANQGANTGNAVAMGYCFGGAAVLELARSGADLKGFATFHGGLKTPADQDYSQTKGSVLVMHGSSDTAVTMDQFATLTNQLEKAGVTHQMVTYSGTPHGFTVFDSKRYRKVADEKSWALFAEYLEETLK